MQLERKGDGASTPMTARVPAGTRLVTFRFDGWAVALCQAFWPCPLCGGQRTVWTMWTGDWRLAVQARSPLTTRSAIHDPSCGQPLDSESPHPHRRARSGRS